MIPESGHPTVEIVRAQASDVKRRRVGVDVDVFSTESRRDGGVMEDYLVPDGLTRFKGI